MTPSLIWHAYTLGILGADQSGTDRHPHATLTDLEGWLDHVTSLGADTILLGPLFASGSHGYDTLDHRRVDDRVGGDPAQLAHLIDTAATHGIGIVLDGVFAFASRDFWRLNDPDRQDNEQDSPWFQHDDTGQLVPWRVDALITPDYGSPGYQAYVAGVMTSWLDRGLAGWRLDSAWSVPAAFWRRVLTTVRQAHPHAWFLGQVFDDDVPAAINTAGYTTATEYAPMHGIRAWLAGADAGAAVDALRLHARNSLGHPMCVFLGNHDFARLADVVPTPMLPAAYAILLTLPGIPALYYGDEAPLAAPGWAAGGGDHLLRPALAPDQIQDSDLTRTLRQLGRLRRERPWLARPGQARMDSIRVEAGILRYSVHGRDETLHVTVNTGDNACHSLAETAGARLLAGSGSDHLSASGWAVWSTPNA